MPTIQKIWRHAIAARDRRDALAAVQRLLDNPQLFGGTPAATAATIRYDFKFRHEHMLRDIPKPPGSGPGVRSKMGPVQCAKANKFEEVSEWLFAFTNFDPGQ